MRKPKGFSLIELLIVGGHHPDHCRHRPSQPVARAYRRKRSLGGGFLGYTCTLTELGPPASGSPASSSWAGILDGVLPSGQKAGYIFGLQDCAGTPKANYTSTAAPVNVAGTGTRAFCSATPGVINFAGDGLVATCLSSGTAIQ